MRRLFNVFYIIIRSEGIGRFLRLPHVFYAGRLIFVFVFVLYVIYPFFSPLFANRSHFLSKAIFYGLYQKFV